MTLSEAQAETVLGLLSFMNGEASLDDDEKELAGYILLSYPNLQKDFGDLRPDIPDIKANFDKKWVKPS